MKKLLCLFLACLLLLCSCGTTEEPQTQTPTGSGATNTSSTTTADLTSTDQTVGTLGSTAQTDPVGNSGQAGTTNVTGGTASGTTKPTQSNKPTCNHQDANADDVCDLCRVSVLVTFDFYVINDLHGKLADTDDNAGVDEMTTYLKNARQNDDNAIFLSAGDMWQGSSESNSTKGKIIVD